MRSGLTDRRTSGAPSPTPARQPTASRIRSTSTRLGAGLVEIPDVPARDPADAVMADPLVPEKRRFCTTCRQPVGRGRDGTPGRSTGFCRKCGAPFSFKPALAPGDLVAGQYQVAGCLAHGGMGWIYLARDRNVSDRWVVLKGLIDADDPDATAAALAERRFLAEVEHPNIVKIFNFVEHDGLGYIVMEYVGGQSLGQILDARLQSNGGQPDPLAPEQAIAYVLEVLPALGHLHDLGLLFCDLKVDNIIQTRHAVKLIDLGGVYRLGDPEGALFGTVGYQAPEVSALGPSVPSDLFTVARTLAVLCFDFHDYQSDHRFTLPSQDAVALLQRYDSLYRFLLKATSPEPDDRFQSAEEMADQLFGVLVEVVADREGDAGRGAQQALHDGLGRRARASRLARAPASAGLARRPGRGVPGDARCRLARRRRCATGRDRGRRPTRVASSLVPRDRGDGAGEPRPGCGQFRRRLHRVAGGDRAEARACSCP